MMILIYFVLLAFSLFVLLKSSDFFTAYASKIAESLKINEFLISITLVALGTSLPEFSSSLVSIREGVKGFVIGNALGATISDILLVCGLIGVIAGYFKLKWKVIKTDVPLLLSAAIILLLVAVDGEITRIDAIFLLLGYSIYLFYFVYENKRRKGLKNIVGLVFENDSKFHWFYVLFVILSSIGIYFGAKFTVDLVLNISSSISFLNVSVISATFVAIGTTLPELSVSFFALKKRKFDMAIGNVIGSTIFNLLVIIGVSALISPILVSSLVLYLMLPFLFVSILFFWLSFSDNTFDRAKGLMFVLVYSIFIFRLLAS